MQGYCWIKMKTRWHGICKIYLNMVFSPLWFVLLGNAMPLVPFIEYFREKYDQEYKQRYLDTWFFPCMNGWNLVTVGHSFILIFLLMWCCFLPNFQNEYMKQLHIYHKVDSETWALLKFYMVFSMFSGLTYIL